MKPIHDIALAALPAICPATCALAQFAMASVRTCSGPACNETGECAQLPSCMAIIDLRDPDSALDRTLAVVSLDIPGSGGAMFTGRHEFVRDERGGTPAQIPAPDAGRAGEGG